MRLVEGTDGTPHVETNILLLAVNGNTDPSIFAPTGRQQSSLQLLGVKRVRFGLYMGEDFIPSSRSISWLPQISHAGCFIPQVHQKSEVIGPCERTKLLLF